MSSYGQVTASQIASEMPPATVMQNAATANGNGTLMNVTGYATAILHITATGMSGGTTINFQGTVDDTTWVDLIGTQLGTSSSATSTTAPGDWTFNIAGLKSLRASIGGYSAGTITVRGYASVLAGSETIAAVSQSGPWSVELLDASGVNKASISAGGAVKIDGSAFTQSVSGTFWQATQPISATSLPLGTGASTAAKQPAIGSAGASSTDVITVQGIASMTALKTDSSATTQPVSGTFWQATQPVSVAALPLPSGASTSAKQPAIGVAGTASTDVVTIQGIASMTPLKTDSSGTTQPISVSSLPLPAGASTAAKQPSFSTAGSAATDVLTVQGAASMTPLKTDSSATTQPVSGTFWPSTQPVTDANLGLAQASTTSGQLGPLVQGAVSTSPPSYTNAKTSPFSLTTAGSLRVDGSGVTQPVSLSGNQATNLAQVNAVTTLTGNGVTGTGSLRVTIASDNSPIPVSASFTPSAFKSTYSVCNPTYIIPATPTDMICFVISAVAKTCKIQRIRLFFITSGGLTASEFYLIKRSTANTGSSTTVNGVALDSSNSAASATLNYYTTNPSGLGTSAGNITIPTIWIATNTATGFYTPSFYDLFDSNNTSQPLTIKSNGTTTESICLNFNGAALPYLLKLKMEVIWTEE